MAECFDVIVAGTGGFGSSAAYHLARRGLRVLGLDRFPAAHDRGSSHGDTRIIRQAYFEHSDYVPLMLKAYDLWHDLEAESGRRLMELCGVLLCGPGDGEVISGSKHSAALHGLQIEMFTGAQTRLRFPGFHVPDDFSAVFEPAAGFLHVEDCVQTHLEQAARHGADIRSGCEIHCWSSDSRTVRVESSLGSFEAASLILAPGAWAPDLLGDVPGMPALKVLRKPLLWYPVAGEDLHLDRGGCCFLFDMPGGTFYGFPSVDGRTLKVAEHSGGQTVADPLLVDRSLQADDRLALEAFLMDVIPAVTREPVRHAVCMYTMTPDSHFIVDRHPAHSNVWFGAGFSGHGFKFTSVIGLALADLASAGRTELPVGFLSLKRFQ